MKKTKIISIYNNKGGVGKTTTTKRLALKKSQEGKKVLIIDMDEQVNITYQFIKKEEIKKDISDVLLEGVDINESIVRSKDGVDIIPSTFKLQKANNQMLLESMKITPATRLKKSINQLKEDYDYILIDCPASIDLLVTNALVTADEIIIPTGTDVYSLDGISNLLEVIKDVKNNYNNKLKIKGVFLNKYKRSNIHNEMKTSLKKIFGDLVAEVAIGDYAIVNENTFTQDEKKIQKHKVNKQFDEVFEEMNI